MFGSMGLSMYTTSLVGTHIFPEIYFDGGDIGDKFATGCQRCWWQIATNINETGGNLPLVSTTQVVNKDNSNRLPTLVNCKLSKQILYKCTVNFYSVVAKQNMKKNLCEFSKKFEMALIV